MDRTQARYLISEPESAMTLEFLKLLQLVEKFNKLYFSVQWSEDFSEFVRWANKDIYHS